MPGLQRAYRRRPVVRRRRFARLTRRGNRFRLRRAPSNNIHHFKRTYHDTGIIVSNSGAAVGARNFTFDKLPGYTEFTSLYDEYRINKVVYKFIPNYTGVDMNPLSTALSMCNFHSILDFDDSTAPAGFTEILQYPSYKMTRGNRMHTRAFTPAISFEVGGNIGYSIKYKQWINCSNITVPHRGIKYVVDQSTATGTFNVITTVYFSMKGVR